MTDNRDLRAMSPEETAVIVTIVSASGVSGGQGLIEELDGLEYAWVTDEAPTRWPRPDEMEVVPD